MRNRFSSTFDGIFSFWERSAIKNCSDVLNKNDRRKVFFVIILQIFSGLFDLLAIAIIGLLGSLAVSGVQSQDPDSEIIAILSYLKLSNFDFQSQVGILGVTAALILLARTVFTIFFTRKMLFFLSRRSASISAELVSKLLNQTLDTIQTKTSQDNLYAVTYGVQMITLGVLGSTVVVISDLVLLLVLSVGLFIFDLSIALTTITLFGVIALCLHFLMSVRAKTLGKKNAELSIDSNERILDALDTYREILVRNRRQYYKDRISSDRMELADTMAEMHFMPNISKYVIEISVVLGSILISGVQFMLQDAASAVATLSIFLAAGSRIAPAVLRVQQGIIQIKSSAGGASPTLKLIQDLSETSILPESKDSSDFSHSGFIPAIKVTALSFSYPQSTERAVIDLNLTILPGKIVSIVGPSGAGKTTLIDLILGVLPSQDGQIKISDQTPLGSIEMWPGAIAYVPQSTSLINGSIKENIALGFAENFIKEDLIWNALEKAQAADFVRKLPQGLHTHIGERGSRLSGGQKQRIGIARALYTQPKLLILDEATSALDGETESLISSSLETLKGDITILLVAHRLSTVRNSDTVIYMSEGMIKFVGTFNQVRKSIPDFDKQAKLMGL
jgi:ATP-binding cassette, subfamily B, bacterial PglK